MQVRCQMKSETRLTEAEVHSMTRPEAIWSGSDATTPTDNWQLTIDIQLIFSGQLATDIQQTSENVEDTFLAPMSVEVDSWLYIKIECFVLTCVYKMSVVKLCRSRIKWIHPWRLIKLIGCSCHLSSLMSDVKLELHRKPAPHDWFSTCRTRPGMWIQNFEVAIALFCSKLMEAAKNHITNTIIITMTTTIATTTQDGI